MAVAAEARPAASARNLLEQRRFLAPALIAPAVIFIAPARRRAARPLGLPQLHRRDRGRAVRATSSASTTSPSQWDDPNFRRALRNTIVFTLLSNVIVVLGAARPRALPRPGLPRQVGAALPDPAPVGGAGALSTIGWLWIFDSLFSVVNWVLIHLHLVDEFNPPQWLGDPELALAAIIDRARLAAAPVRDRDHDRRAGVDPEGGRRRGEGRRGRRAARSSGT